MKNNTTTISGVDRRAFALVDCNNFYISCERAFDPRLVDRPVIALSNNDGCVVARSNEVKELGVKMGAPVYQVQDIIRRHRVKVYSSNYTLYGDMSRRVMETLNSFTPDMEVYSIDEAFLDLSGFGRLSLADYGRTMRQKVGRWTGIPVSVGIAPTKTLAKLANKIAKKSGKAGGVLNLCNSPHLAEALRRTATEDVWGIGPRQAKKLSMVGIKNALQLRDANDDWILKKLTVVGLKTVLELRGEVCYELECDPPANKGIAGSRSFGRPVESLEELRQAVSVYVSRAACKLRRQKLAAGVLTVLIMTNPFKTDGPRYCNYRTTELPVATDDTGELIGYAVEALEKIYRPGCKYKKAGVLLDRLVPEDQVQGNLFDSRDRNRQKKLMTVMDKINACVSANALTYASAGLKQPWKTKFLKRSQRYTTNWNELPRVKTDP